MKVESAIIRMMGGYADTIKRDIGTLWEHNNPHAKLAALLLVTRALSKVIEAELANHRS